MPTALTDKLLKEISSNKIDDEILDLRSSNIVDARAIQLASALKTNTHIKVVYLGDNEIKDKGIIALSSVTNLEELSVQKNNFGSAGLKALSEASNLKLLDISNNEVKGYISYFFTNKNLKELIAVTCGITSDDIDSELLEKGMSQLTDLNLSHNAIGDIGAKALIKIKTLQRLCLPYNQIADQTTFDNCKIAELYLHNNPCTRYLNLVSKDKKQSKPGLEVKNVQTLEASHSTPVKKDEHKIGKSGLTSVSFLNKSSAFDEEERQKEKSKPVEKDEVKSNSQGKS